MLGGTRACTQAFPSLEEASRHRREDLRPRVFGRRQERSPVRDERRCLLEDDGSDSLQPYLFQMETMA